MFYKLSLANELPGCDQSSWVLHLPTTIGRNPDHEVCINHDSISRTHCRLSLNGDEALMIRDMDSMNGTYVNHERVSQSLLMPGDMIQLGSVILRIQYTSDTDYGKPSAKPREYDLSVTTPMKINFPKQTTESEPQLGKKWWPFGKGDSE